MANTMFDTHNAHHEDLLTLIEPAADGIVSKPLIDTDSCKVVLFAMDAGQELSEHSSPHTALVHVLDGAMRWRAGDAEYDMRAHDWLLIPAGAPHGVVVQQTARFVLTLLKAPDET